MMEYAIVPQDCILSTGIWLREQETGEEDKSFACSVRKVTAEDIAKIEADIAAKKKRMTVSVSITGELNKSRKIEKSPEIPFEEIPKNSQQSGVQYNPVKFKERAAG